MIFGGDLDVHNGESKDDVNGNRVGGQSSCIGCALAEENKFVSVIAPIAVVVASAKGHVGGCDEGDSPDGRDNGHSNLMVLMDAIEKSCGDRKRVCRWFGGNSLTLRCCLGKQWWQLRWLTIAPWAQGDGRWRSYNICRTMAICAV